MKGLLHDPKWGGFNLKWMKRPTLRFGHFTPTPFLLLRLRRRRRKGVGMKNPAIAGLLHPFQVGGEGGIRTPGKSYPLRQFSKLLVSATHPPLRCG